MTWRLYDKVLSPDPPVQPCMGSSSGLQSGHCAVVSGRTTSYWVQTSGRLSSWRIEMVWVQRRWANVGPDTNDTYQLGKIVHDIVMSSQKSVFWIRPPMRASPPRGRISCTNPKSMPRVDLSIQGWRAQNLGRPMFGRVSKARASPPRKMALYRKLMAGKWKAYPKPIAGKSPKFC
jgi:hypothetical protein